MAWKWETIAVIGAVVAGIYLVYKIAPSIGQGIETSASNISGGLGNLFGGVGSIGTGAGNLLTETGGGLYEIGSGTGYAVSGANPTDLITAVVDALKGNPTSSYQQGSNPVNSSVVSSQNPIIKSSLPSIIPGVSQSTVSQTKTYSTPTRGTYKGFSGNFVGGGFVPDIGVPNKITGALPTMSYIVK